LLFQAYGDGTEGAIAMDERRASQQTAAVDKDGIAEIRGSSIGLLIATPSCLAREEGTCHSDREVFFSLSP
jgi:hypothetical protein